VAKKEGKIARNIANLFEGIGAPPPVETGAPAMVAPPAEDMVQALPVGEVQLDPVQVRYFMSPADLAARADAGSRWAREQLDELRELGEHMREHGQIQPIRVFATTVGRPYQVLVGHRRLMAAELVGLPTILAVVLPEEPDELRKLEYQVGENVQRRNFNDMERARIFERFRGAIARRGRPTRPAEEPAPDDAAIAARLGVKPDRMAQILRLTRFSRRAQDIIIEEGWPEKVLRPLHQVLGQLLIDEAAQIEALHELARRAALKDTPLSNAMVAEYVREWQRGQQAEPGRTWVQAQLRQLTDATRDLVRLREQFATGHEMPADARETLRLALDNLEHELAQTRTQVFGDPPAVER
jgi:ParB/RepB/Spo0J family partition protein